MFSSGIFSIKGKIKIALFFTGRNHAGENLTKVLEKRHPNRAPPIQMSDASPSNVPKGYATVRGSCTDHARRGFADASSRFPDQCLDVIEALGQVYKNDEITKNEKMSPFDRMRFHRRHSAMVLFELRLWLLGQFEEKRMEPNSALGHAISYMISIGHGSRCSSGGRMCRFRIALSSRRSRCSFREGRIFISSAPNMAHLLETCFLPLSIRVISMASIRLITSLPYRSTLQTFSKTPLVGCLGIISTASPK